MKKICCAALVGVVCLSAFDANAHGIVGNRFFPATLNIDDPAVADELTAPQVRAFQERNEDDTLSDWATETSAEFSKRLTKNFGLSVGGTYVDQSEGVGGGDGFDNFEASAKYQFFTNAPHETIISAGLDWDIGGSGSRHVGRESYSSLTPEIFFGKGMGDLPGSMNYLKPFAITGVVGVEFPTERYNNSSGDGNPNTVNYGFTLQYSLPYLQQHVKDIGLSAPFDNMIPIVEVNFQSPINRTDNYTTTGTINPGVIWTGQQAQFGLEAVLPINGDSGKGVGVIGQLHFYLDDLFPQTLSKPLFGN